MRERAGVSSRTEGGAALWAGGADLCLVTLVTPVYRPVKTVTLTESGAALRCDL